MTTMTKIQNSLEVIPVYFSQKMAANISSLSPSSGKPTRVVGSWERLGLPIKLLDPRPVSPAELKLVHEPDYVDGILGYEIKNGFGTRSIEVADTLPYTTGSMLSAAREAIRNGKVAVAPCSGFHHAGFKKATGYCTFNGLMVTAFVLKEEGLVNKVGILDFDMHYGNGTDELIKHHNTESWIVHYTAGREYISQYQAKEFLDMIPIWVKKMSLCDVILYQAGADPHISDPLGGFLTTKQLKERDGIVFEVAKSIGVPIAWNLAGGYQVDSNGGIPAILKIHTNTMRECIRAYL
jgi:acetoin utilization deacetylase AcuC-like enzyme